MKRFWNRLKTKLFFYLLESDTWKRALEEPIQSPEITLVHVRDTLPELEKIKEKYIHKVNKAMGELEVFVTVIQVMNEGLEDERLDSPHGTLMIMHELERYGVVTRNRLIPCFNYSDDRSPGIPSVFFDV